MRVLINALCTSGEKTGVGHYTAELIRCLQEQTQPGEIDCFPRPVIRQLRSLINGMMSPWLGRRSPILTDQRKAPGPAPKPRLTARTLAALRIQGRAILQHHFQSLIRKGHYDLYHEPNFLARPCDVRTAITIYDLSVLHHPEWHPPERVAAYEANFFKGVQRCDHIFTISTSVRREIINTFNINPDRITVAYCGVRKGLQPLPVPVVRDALRRLKLPDRYFLHVGTIEPRKNIMTLLRAYCALPHTLREAYPLLLVGGWGWNAGDVGEYLGREGRHRGVRHLGYLSDKHMVTLYNGARALLFPSHYEGFGLPALEMFACGGAVIASRIDALVEIAGLRAHFVDPNDVDGWRRAMHQAATDDEWFFAHRSGVTELARHFTWERCAANTLQGYRSICNDATIVDRRLGKTG